MNYFIIGATVIVVGAGAYYIIHKLKGSVRPIEQDMITVNEVDVVKLSCIGPWLKDQNVDSDDFGKVTRLFAFKDIKSDSKNLGLPKNIISQINNNCKKEAIAFALTDMKINTRQVLIVIGKSIDESLKEILKHEVTEIHLK